MTDLPSAVSDADSVLISGPPMSGKYDLLMRLIGTWSPDPVFISTGHTAERIRSDFEELTGRTGDDVIVIDCVTHEQGDKRTDTPRTKYVASAGNLTDIGIKFTDVVESSFDVDRAVGLYSLSQLLMYWDPERIYQFTRVLASQASGEGWPLAATIGSTAHDQQVIHTLHEPFDVVVETRIDEHDREFRARNRVEQPTDWMSF